MGLDELVIGEEVKVYTRSLKGPGQKQSGYRLLRQGKIVDLKSEFILLDCGYKERFDIIEFRTHRYRLFKTCGAEVKFEPLPDKVKIEEAIRRKVHQEYLDSPAGRGEKATQERRKSGTSVSWKKVRSMLGQGKTPEEIAQTLNSTLWIVKGLVSRYGNNIKREDDLEMFKREPKITPDQLLEECRQHGTDRAALTLIAEKYKLTIGTVENYVYAQGIPGKLAEEKKAQTVESAPPAEENNSHEEVMGGGPAGDESQKDLDPELQKEDKPQTMADIVDEESLAADRETLLGKNSIEEALSEAGREMAAKMSELLLSSERPLKIATNITMRRPKLKPKCLVGEATGREYYFAKEGLAIGNGESVKWEELDSYIEELMEISYQQKSQISA
jgi:hypothetical protein